MTFVVAIVGRPNVGKSTLFNRLVGKRLALVDNLPGVTRDRREGEARLADLRFTAVDTAGLDDAAGASLEARMRAQTEQAVTGANVALFVVDAGAGVTAMDRHFADWLRRLGAPVILVANKCDAKGAEVALIDAYALGWGEAVAISASHGDGMADLYAALSPHAEEAGGVSAPDGETAPLDVLRLAIVGRPNVGKSTLVNLLVGEDRMLTGPEAGITRDSIAVAWDFRGQRIELVDTAGLRRRARVTERLERLSAENAARAVRFAHVVALVIEGGSLLERQDLAIARHAVEEGRALVVIVNKWDLVPPAERKDARRRLADSLTRSLPQARGVPTLMLSALTGDGVRRLMPAVMNAYRVWNIRLATGPLNRWLAGVTGRHPPPLVSGRRTKLRYLTQTKARPPTFVLFATRAERLPDSYQRFLVNGLRETFGLPGVPIRILLRQGKNPYAPD